MKRSAITWIVICSLLSGLKAQTDNILPEISKFSADLNTGNTDLIFVDSLISGSQKFDPLFSKFPGWSELGNMALPALPLEYTGLGKTTTPAFLYPYLSYLGDEEVIEFYDTKKPYSQFNYNQELTSGKDNVAQLIKFFYSRNFGHEINVTGVFDFNSSTGQYSNQSATESLIGFNLSIQKRKYRHYASLERTQFKIQENGGVIDDSLAYSVDKQYSLSGVGVNLSDASSGTGITRLKGWQYIDVFDRKREAMVTDSSGHADNTKGIKPLIIHQYNYTSAKRLYLDGKPSLEFYPDTLLNGQETQDSVQHYSLVNNISLRMVFPLKDSSDILVEGGLRHNLMHFYSYDNSSWKQSLGVRAYSSLDIKDLKLSADGSLMFAGYQAGDHELKLNAEIRGAGRVVYPGLGLFSRTVSPDLFVNQYYSNHYSWLNSFKSQKEQGISLRLTLPEWKLDIESNFHLISDWIYFNEEAEPAQRSNSTIAANLTLRKSFKAGPLRSDNFVYLNYTPAEEIPLPLLSAYTSTYMHHDIHFNKTDGLLQIEYGFDIRYTSSYNGFAYMPASAVFYMQKSRKLGNYPVADLFFIMRVKRTRFFVKWDHANYGFTGDNIFSVLHYPMKHRYLKFGVYWHFHD